MRTFAQLEKWAECHGYVVEKIGRRIEWYHEDNHSMIGVCSTVGDTLREICADILARGFTEQNKLV